MVSITRVVSVITDADTSVWVSHLNWMTVKPQISPNVANKKKRGPTMTHLRSGKRTHARHITTISLIIHWGYISDGCKMGDWSYNTVKGPKYSSIRSSLAVAASDKAIFWVNSMPMLSTSTERILITLSAIHATQYMVAPTKLRMIRMNIANLGRDLSPWRL